MVVGPSPSLSSVVPRRAVPFRVLPPGATGPTRGKRREPEKVEQMYLFSIFIHMYFYIMENYYISLFYTYFCVFLCNEELVKIYFRNERLVATLMRHVDNHRLAKGKVWGIR